MANEIKLVRNKWRHGSQRVAWPRAAALARKKHPMIDPLQDQHSSPYQGKRHAAVETLVLMMCNSRTSHLSMACWAS
jgi:hypothetical protein